MANSIRITGHSIELRRKRHSRHERVVFGHCRHRQYKCLSAIPLPETTTRRYGLTSWCSSTAPTDSDYLAR